jgi:adenylylsulfate kinase-like enzyme
MIKSLTIPKIFWFTGQAGAGKTELAKMLQTRLIREQSIVQQNIVPNNIWSCHIPNKKFVIIDGDDIRELYKNTDYSVEGRKANVDFVQKMCLFLKKNNIVPIVCMVSPFAEQRRAFIEAENGIEIYVHCNEIRGREHFHIDYYEKPTNYDNSVEISTTFKSVEQSFEELWKQIGVK